MAIQPGAATSYYFLASGLPNSDGPVSGMIWYKQTGAHSSAYEGLFSLGDSGASAWQLNTGLVSTVLDFYDGATLMNGTANPCDGNWHSLAFTVSASNVVKTYTDGTLDYTGGATKATGVSSTQFRVGKTFHLALNISTAASLYGLKIWNAELSGAQITAETGSYAPVLSTGLWDSFLLTTANATITGTLGNVIDNNSTSWSTVSDPPPLGAANNFMWSFS